MTVGRNLDVLYLLVRYIQYLRVLNLVAFPHRHCCITFEGRYPDTMRNHPRAPHGTRLSTGTRLLTVNW